METITLIKSEENVVVAEQNDSIAAIKELEAFELALVGGGSATLLY